MKKSKKRLTFAAAIAGAALAASLTACHETVYGPPETPASETFDPASEIPEDVYGPPQDMDITEEEEEQDVTEEENSGTGISDAEEDENTITEEPSEKNKEYNPGEEIPVCVYGPPEDM